MLDKKPENRPSIVWVLDEIIKIILDGSNAEIDEEGTVAVINGNSDAQKKKLFKEDCKKIIAAYNSDLIKREHEPEGYSGTSFKQLE